MVTECKNKTLTDNILQMVI